jgi:hypothetical protein
MEWDAGAYTVTWKGQQIVLLPKEYALLHYLYANAGQTFSREQLLDAVWTLETPVDRTVDDHVYRLRRKLARWAPAVQIDTVRGLGYRLKLAKEAGMDETRFGLLIGAVGAGSVAGALMAEQWSGWRQRPLARMTTTGIASGFLIIVAGFAGMGFFHAGLTAWLPLCAALGYCSAQSAVPFGYVLQMETTDETVGPVSALASALQTSSMLIAPVLGALMASWWSAGRVFLGVGIATTGETVAKRDHLTKRGSVYV